ncbi:dihydroneopterin aldolase [Laribacter hongkongensis]|jgi:dihydroneopterin aldolase|uniref:Dihydroneopterin aldolase n=2 Tax=Laribacter hongkongensis TaxID=168471 RepID=C1DCY0_LARHH|nr:dihydroneopterin aldolase [Laribacter hongkongensis]MBP8813667.1 dihydroneopterin aldolase [Laribacter sp.]ACO73615.1 FolB [Laribacter hongkongensis HLHK9]ASJ23444.1 7,8-dihydroneopterin aldolase [Laribacter hongkongensis]MBE5528164.1 dienelactone hydrolase [Laribacter hongkongensis]MBP9528020.1 dihydroneopterin aldolase [Laribacter sp.]
MDIIFLREVRVDTVIGVYEWERRAPQTIELDLDIGIPSEAPCHSDNIGDTIHYGVVVERLRATLAEQHFLLIEALAEHIARIVREEFGAPWVRVAVTKLGILPGVKKVGVQIERGHRPR